MLMLAARAVAERTFAVRTLAAGGAVPISGALAICGTLPVGAFTACGAVAEAALSAELVVISVRAVRGSAALGLDVDLFGPVYTTSFARPEFAAVF
jgi:hypothetical protein